MYIIIMDRSASIVFLFLRESCHTTLADHNEIVVAASKNGCLVASCCINQECYMYLYIQCIRL